MEAEVEQSMIKHMLKYKGKKHDVAAHQKEANQMVVQNVVQRQVIYTSPTSTLVGKRQQCLA